MRMVALVPPLAASLCVMLRKRETITRSMEGLLKGQALSQQMSTLLARAMTARANVLVCGSTERAAAEITAGLLSAAPAKHRIMVLHAGLDVALGTKRGATQPLPITGEDTTTRAAALLGYEHLVSVSPRANHAAGAVLAMAGGGGGIVATYRERTLERCLTSIVGELVLSRPGLTFEAASAVLAQGLDLALFVGHAEDGKLRIERIAEVEHARGGDLLVRDLYTLTQGDGKGFVFTPVNAPLRAPLA
jgi:Flp pilus assembly CpaF family ATPase